MGRLINTDHICFRCSYDGDCMSSIDKCRKCYYYVCDFEDIEDTPTAYDVEKVVTEVKDYHDLVQGCYLKEIVEIVKRGGMR